MIELEQRSMRGDPDREQESWLDKLTELDRKRARYQEMAADDLITFDELRVRLAELDETRGITERELKTLQAHKVRVAELEIDRDALLDSLVDVAPDAMASLTSEERYHVYKSLKLRVVAYQDGSVEVSGTFGVSLDMYQSRTRRAGSAGRGVSDRVANAVSLGAP